MSQIDRAPARALANKVFIRKCSRCEETENLHVHHKNNNPEDNRKENLEFLCPFHHSAEHSRRIPTFDHYNKGDSWRRELEWNRR
jgi:hypothetical protein